MVNKAKIEEWISTASDTLTEQQWYQELRSKWDELDPQSKGYFKLGLSLLTVLAITFNLISAVWKAHSLKSELEEKNGLVNFIRTSNDEIHRLKDSLPMGGGAETGSGPWLTYFESLATGINLDKANLSVQSERAGVSTDYSKETLIELKIKQANVKQLANFLKAIETGSRPVKVRNLQVTPQADQSGYLDAVLALSGFNTTNSP